MASSHVGVVAGLDDREEKQQRPGAEQLHDSTSQPVPVPAPAGGSPAAAANVSNCSAFALNAPALPALDTAHFPHHATHHSSPASAGLSIRTNCGASSKAGAHRPAENPTILYQTPLTTEPALLHHNWTSPTTFPAMGSSLRSNLSTASLASSLSPASASTLPSPYLAAMADLTPLPSPVVGSEQSSAWRKRGHSVTTRSRDNSLDDSTPAGPQPTAPGSPSRKKKGYGSLAQEAAIANAANAAGFQENQKTSSHTRNRSISDFTPEPLHNIRPRHVTVGSRNVPSNEATARQMHREAYLATQRGLAAQSLPPANHLPTPPPSTSSVAGSDDADEEQPHLEDGTVSEYLEIHCGIRNKRRKFRQLRKLGQGTFSTVMLATREHIPAHPTPEIEDHLDPHKLVAVKIVGFGPAGGADEERVEISLKREVEILKRVSHPSLIHLKACEYQDTRALLVLTYCPGGDLFDFASERRDLLTPALIQRMFAELVSAVTYLHSLRIVHRDIKLENVLVNLPELVIQSLENPITHPTAIVTLTDLGLGRRIPDPPKPPTLTTRCGSEDYAAPEILLGQPYDGRLTDGWALGVLLYALLEGRLPFDAPPGKPDRSRNTHRIARCDWIWCRFGDEDGDWDPDRGKDYEGANTCVEGLLKKVSMGRRSLDDIEKLDYVQQVIQVPGRQSTREEDEDEDLL